jgi:hypothetical protein
MKTILSRALAYLFAAVLAFAPIEASLALSVDQTRILSPRDAQGYQPQYFRATINFNDKNIGSGQAFGAMALNTFIDSIDCYVSTAFNAATTNVITFGTTAANANEIVASGITAGTPGIYHLTSAAGLGLAVTAAGPITLYAKYAQTGAAATTGAVTCVIKFEINNDM